MRPEKIKFNANETILLCGDPKTESWNQIPFSQAEFSLKSFLSSRAYYEPHFEFKNDRLFVDPGKVSVSTAVHFFGQPPGFDDITLRDVIEKPMNTDLLNTVQNWTLTRLKNLGYACPDVKLQAFQASGVVEVRINTGPRYSFEEPVIADALGIYPESYQRFEAFKKGQTYSYDLTKLTTSRAELDGIIVSQQFNYTCPKSTEMATAASPQAFLPLPLQEQLIGGDRQLITLGAGASTEEIPIFQATWKSVRMDKFGSNLSVSLYASQREQKLQSIYADYLFRYIPRLSLNPTVTIEHDNEPTYQYMQFQVSSPLTYKTEFNSSSLTSSVGPALNRVYSVNDGTDLADTFFALVGDLSFMTHEFESYQSDPRDGSSLDFNVQVLSPGLSVNPVATIFQFTGTHLFNLFPVDPPQWIFGFRYGAATTLTRIQPSATSTLPAQYYHTLGGDANLRGFGRDEINNSNLGAMTDLYLSTELRFAKTLPYGIEPFLFFDLGSLGEEPFGIDGALYASPGFGIRWSTPFGAIRSTLAHGYLWNDSNPDTGLEHLQFFLSFGKEF